MASMTRTEMLARLDEIVRVVDINIDLCRFADRLQKMDIAEQCVAHLCDRHGALFRFSGGAYFLSAGGVRASCTGGHYLLLLRWRQAAARIDRP